MVSKRDKAIKRMITYKQYHIPSCANYMKRPKNAIYISTANSIEHERAKVDLCYELKEQDKYYITEAVRNEKDEKGKERRVDVVCLDDGTEYEIETDPKRARRFEGQDNVVVIKLWKKK